MKKPPAIPTKGPKAFRKLAKEAVDYMVATTPVAGAGVSVSELPGGSQINAAGGLAGGVRVIVTGCLNGVPASGVALYVSAPVELP